MARENNPDAMTQMVAAAFHQMRAQRKKERASQPKGGHMHHRANTDWWNYVDRS